MSWLFLCTQLTQKTTCDTRQVVFCYICFHTTKASRIMIIVIQ